MEVDGLMARGAVTYFWRVQILNFPPIVPRLKSTGTQDLIWDQTRKKYLVLTPEEWVRQHTVSFLLNELNVPAGLLNVEKSLQVSGRTKRYDIVVYKPDGSLWLLVECKAPQVAITQHTFDQIARYNMTLRSSYQMVTNGLQHYYCTMDYEAAQYNFLRELPQFSL